MSNDVAKTDQPALIEVLQNSLYPGARSESVSMALGYCKAANLDPMQKPVHIVPMWSQQHGAMRDVIMPGIGLYRIQAARTGQYIGLGEPVFGPDVTGRIGSAEITYPQWCKITVRRRMPDGFVAEFTAQEFWIENYASKGGRDRDITPNAMWARRPYGQLAKCAEAQALRKAFPEVGQSETAEEMMGKEPDYYDPQPDPPKSARAEKFEKLIQPTQKPQTETVLEGEFVAQSEAIEQPPGQGETWLETIEYLLTFASNKADMDGIKEKILAEPDSNPAKGIAKKAYTKRFGEIKKADERQMEPAGIVADYASLCNLVDAAKTQQDVDAILSVVGLIHDKGQREAIIAACEQINETM